MPALLLCRKGPFIGKFFLRQLFFVVKNVIQEVAILEHAANSSGSPRASPHR